MTSVRRTGAARLAVALIGLFFPHAEVAAQGVRSGFWLEGTAGTGTIRNTSAGSDGVTVGFGSAYAVRVGGSLNRRVLVGLEFLSVRSSELVLAGGTPPVEAENLSLAPVVIWYVGRSGFFLKGGAGLARGSYEPEPGSGVVVTTERIGSGLTFGLGFDIGFVRGTALSASLGTYVAAIGDVQVGGTLVDDVITTVYEASIGVMLR